MTRPVPGNTPVGDSPRVAAAMSPLVVAILPGVPVQDALTVMLGSGVRHLPIIDNDRCIGVLYESDALWELYLHPEAEHTALQCARTPAPFIALDAGIDEAAQVLERAGADALVVADRNGRVTGILTATDVVRMIAGTHGPRRPAG